MKKALIIGIYGFAGSYLRKELEQYYDCYGVDVISKDDRVRAVDMTDYSQAEEVIADIKPDYIFNLAGQASPMISWEKINFTMELNVNLSINILEACRKHCPSARILLIGSANQYDLSKSSNEFTSEDTPLVNNSPYAISKNTQEALVKLYVKKHNLDVIMTRSFNHIGVGQKVGFVVTDYSKRIVDLERGELETFNYGNLDTWRDFSDARDVVCAYRLLAELGKSGEVYNVGSGRSFYIRDLIGYLVSKSEMAASKTTLPVRLDDSELVHYAADITKLKKDTGFEPKYDIYNTLDEILESFRAM